MKSQLTRAEKLPVPKPTGGDVSPSFHDELVATIHGAFGVAVDIAVLEVTKLVGGAMEELRGRMQRENEALQQRLRSAEAKLDSARRAGSPFKRTETSDPEEEELTGESHGYFREICENGHMHSKELPEPACRESVACDALLKEYNDDISDSPNHSCQEPAVECSDSPPRPHGNDKSRVEEVTIKEEKPVEVGGGPGCCFDSLGVEGFGPDSLSLVQSKMLAEWKPELLDIQSQDPDTLLPCTSLALAHPPNMTITIPSASDLPSLSSEFPNIFQPADPAPIPAAPPQVYGVHVRTTRANPGQPAGGIGSCKICGQTFHQPSLLRRHYGQCQQKLQQRCRQPTAGTKRTKLQLYPPGCSPFRCTECNREFNRLENLKRHLRIHTGERPYTCSVCSKCFRHSGALTRHFRIHTGEKPYICGQCGRAFPNSGGLKFHQRSHR